MLRPLLLSLTIYPISFIACIGLSTRHSDRANQSVYKPFRVLMDVSDKAVSFTPRVRQRTVELFTRYRTHHGFFAFLFSSRVAPYYSRIFFASLGRLTFELNYFTEKSKALDWLCG